MLGLKHVHAEGGEENEGNRVAGGRRGKLKIVT